MTYIQLIAIVTQILDSRGQDFVGGRGECTALLHLGGSNQYHTTRSCVKTFCLDGERASGSTLVVPTVRKVEQHIRSVRSLATSFEVPRWGDVDADLLPPTMYRILQAKETYNESYNAKTVSSISPSEPCCSKATPSTNRK